MKGYNSDYGSGNTSGNPENGTDYNVAHSSSVKKVDSINIIVDAHSVPRNSIPNSVSQNYKNGKLESERYYDKDKKAYLDIDYSNHGNPKMHPIVPHQHDIWFDGNGKFHREDGEPIK